MRIKNTYIKKEVCGVNVVVPVGQSAKDFPGTVQLNGIANFIWNILATEKGATEDEVVEKMLTEYIVDEDRARSDLKKFLGQLREIKCLEE